MSLFPGNGKKTGNLVIFQSDFSCGFPGSIIEPCGRDSQYKE